MVALAFVRASHGRHDYPDQLHCPGTNNAAWVDYRPTTPATGAPPGR